MDGSHPLAHRRRRGARSVRRDRRDRELGRHLGRDQLRRDHLGRTGWLPQHQLGHRREGRLPETGPKHGAACSESGETCSYPVHGCGGGPPGCALGAVWVDNPIGGGPASGGLRPGGPP
jgi:hypothetical protein